MQKGANFCTTLLSLYHTSDWLNQQNLPQLQVAVYLFFLNLSTIFLSTKSLPSLNTTVILCVGTLENWKLLLSLFTTVVIGWNVFTRKKLLFKIEFKYILFSHKRAFHRLINSWSENTTVSIWGKRIAAEQQKMPQFLFRSFLIDYISSCYRNSGCMDHWPDAAFPFVNVLSSLK